ncbi:MAG TPA: copper resistance protein CopZ [Prevotella sp.]|nr:copper resistance protein CopZ [Prevotella sp.]
MKKTFSVNGMKCDNCKAKVEGALMAVDGIKNAVVSLSDKNVTVEYDETRVNAEQMKNAVDNSGHFEMIV